MEVPGQEGWFDSVLPTDNAPMASSLDFDTHQSHGFDDGPRAQSELGKFVISCCFQPVLTVKLKRLRYE